MGDIWMICGDVWMICRWYQDDMWVIFGWCLSLREYIPTLPNITYTRTQKYLLKKKLYYCIKKYLLLHYIFTVMYICILEHYTSIIVCLKFGVLTFISFIIFQHIQDQTIKNSKQSPNQTIFSLVNITFHSLSCQLPSRPPQITHIHLHIHFNILQHIISVLSTPPHPPPSQLPFLFIFPVY